MSNTFSLAIKPLQNILSSMQPICVKRTTIEATSYILFHVSRNELIIKSTDLEVSLQASCSLQESTFQEGASFLVSGRRVFDIIKELDTSVQFRFDDRQLHIETETVNLALHTKDPQEFPAFPESIENITHMQADDVLAMIESVSFLIPKNNTNPALNGVLIEGDQHGTRMTATDGHCLAQTHTYAYTFEEPQRWLVPRRAIFELKKIIESSNESMLFIGLCGNHLVFSGEGFNFFTKLLNESFPAYAHILDTTNFTSVKAHRNTLMKTLRRATCLLSGHFIATKFSFTGAQKLEVHMHNKEVGSLHETLDLHTYDGTDQDIWFYAPYIMNGLHVFDQPDVAFYVKDMAHPIVFDSSRNNISVTYLVMPVSQPTG